MSNPTVADNLNGLGFNGLANYINGSDSDSRSAYGAKPRKNNSCFSTLKSTGSRDFCDPETRLKMKKLVKVLRGIVQGADEMGTVAV
ncbi:hypothetical protein V6N13_136012 [Hibiscus sabdariffa]|uniref:Uncharacterized protein n=1 Tax=Hibiscus sabdariffa TaxID=183260 RepID=A0ABR2QTB2_9ROSI